MTDTPRSGQRRHHRHPTSRRLPSPHPACPALGALPALCLPSALPCPLPSAPDNDPHTTEGETPCPSMRCRRRCRSTNQSNQRTNRIAINESNQRIESNHRFVILFCFFVWFRSSLIPSLPTLPSAYLGRRQMLRLAVCAMHTGRVLGRPRPAYGAANTMNAVVRLPDWRRSR